MTTLDVTVSMPKPGRTKYSYSLTTREGSAGPLQQEYTIDVNQALVDASCLKIDKALQNAADDPDLLRRTLLMQGRLLYRQLLQPPEGTVLELVRQLNESTEPLLVNSNESVVPWELLHDGEDFLGLKADIGRRSKVNARVLGGRDIGPVQRALVVGDTLGDLPKAREEAERIGGWLAEQGIECTVLIGDEAELGRIILELTDEHEPYDLFHFSGHVSNAPDAMGLLVHRRELVDEPALRTLAGRGAPPVVFINGCASAGLTMSVCRLFMMMGAKTVVGTRTVVDDDSALRFAEAFYGQLRERVAAGAAVREARLMLSEQEDNSWASFVLYGDPNARITHDRRPSPQPGPGPKQRDFLPFAPDARALMRQISRRTATAGLITSVDLLAGLVETKQIQERALPRIGKERLTALRMTLRGRPGPNGRGAQEQSSGTGAGGTINGHRPRVEASDTVSRVLALADEIVSAAGRGALTIDDIAAALLRVGGSTCAELLELHGISMEQLLAPPGEEVEAPAGVSIQRVLLDRLDPRALGVVLCARLLAVVGNEMISSRALLRAFALTGSETLGRALQAQGKDAGQMLRRLADINPPRVGEVSTRVEEALRSANSRAQGEGRAGETELLLALLADPRSSAGETLRRLGIDPERLVRDLSPGRVPEARAALPQDAQTQGTLFESAETLEPEGPEGSAYLPDPALPRNNVPNPRESQGPSDPATSLGLPDPAGSRGPNDPPESLGPNDPPGSQGLLDPAGSQGLLDRAGSTSLPDQGESPDLPDPLESQGSAQPRD